MATDRGPGALVPRLLRATRVLPGAVGARGRFLDAVARLDAGDAGGWQDAVRALLRRADDAARPSGPAAGLEWFDKALRIAYHPTLHYGREGSPLAADPEGFLAPFRDCAVGRVLLSDGTEDPALSAPRPPGDRADGPRRLLVIAQRNWTFAEPLIEALEAEGVQVRRFEVDDLPSAQRPTRERVLRARLAHMRTGERIPTPAALAEQYAWADVTMVEWGHHVLAWASLLDQRPRVLAARFHRFEAYTPFPLLTCFGAVDRVLFVSPPVACLVRRLAPQLARAGQVIEVDNFLSRDQSAFTPQERDPFLLTQVGWARPVKDVLFSLDILERLRAEDSRYRLRLIGPDLPGEQDPWAHQVRARLEALPADAVELLGPRDDVPRLLGQSGWILSTSLVEGVHEAVMEGLAAGCGAIIRDWPDTRPHGGAASIYPEDWIVTDPAQAAERILATDEAALRELSAAGSAWVRDRRDPAAVTARYLEALRVGADAA